MPDPDESPIRLLVDPPLPGAANMARDEALLIGVGQGTSAPTLRFYQWDEPTISLGYFQRYAEYESLPGPAGNLPLVRRQTGGGAILHDCELTYSLTLPTGHHLIGNTVSSLYEFVHRAIIKTLASIGLDARLSGTNDRSSPRQGPFFCFARRHEQDILIGSDKLAGSAQRRTKHAVLQQGSIILDNRFGQHPTANPPALKDIDTPTLIELLTAQLANSGHAKIMPDSWHPTELTQAQTLSKKYASPEWTRKR